MTHGVIDTQMFRYPPTERDQVHQWALLFKAISTPYRRKRKLLEAAMALADAYGSYDLAKEGHEMFPSGFEFKLFDKGRELEVDVTKEDTVSTPV